MRPTVAAERLVLDGATVVTMDADLTEHDVGHVVVEGTRIAAVGAGRWPGGDSSPTRVVDAHGCLLTPGLVNTHHHLYQWATRGLALDSTLFEWLTTLYPIWAGHDEETVGATAAAGLARLARTGCTTTMDHHYVFPQGGGDLFAAEVEAARTVGLRFLPTRGSMDLGQSRGGLPPDRVVEDLDAILEATAAAIDRFHDPSPDSMLRVGVAPCSPFSVTEELLREAAALARDRGVLLHTHLAETDDEASYCDEHFGTTPLGYMESLGWLGDDVWFAHGVHFSDDDLGVLARTGTGVAHCPTSNARLGAGICRTRDLRAAGVRVGLGVDGPASNEASSMVAQAGQALLFARATGGPRALGCRDALELATIGGARVLGWDDAIGSLEAGKQADLALWRLDGLAHADIADPVAALVLGTTPPLALLLVGGRTVVEDDHLVTAAEESLTRGAVDAAGRLLERSR